MSVSDETLDRWQALADAATEGPWCPGEAWNGSPTVETGDFFWSSSFDTEDEFIQQVADAHFIVAAREAVPRLIAALRECRRERAIAVEELNRRLDLDHQHKGVMLRDHERITQLEAERDELRAEVERLRGDGDLRNLRELVESGPDAIHEYLERLCQ